ncbi:hypothetical protein ABQ286_13915, partial [Lacticaseibacillus rhamnosus]
MEPLVQDADAKLWDRAKEEYRSILYRDITLLPRHRTENTLILTKVPGAGVALLVGDTKNFFQSTVLIVMLA